MKKILLLFVSAIVVLLAAGCAKNPFWYLNPETDPDHTSATIVARLSPASPESKIIVMGAEELVSAVEFSSTVEPWRVERLTLEATAIRSVSEFTVEYKNKFGELENKTMLAGGGPVKFSDLNVYVPKDGKTKIAVKARLRSLIQGAKSGDQLSVSISSSGFHATSDITGQTVGVINSVTGNTMVVRKTKPVVALLPLLNTILLPGTQVISRFQVIADAAGDIYLRELNWHYNSVGAKIIPESVRLYRESDYTSRLDMTTAVTGDHIRLITKNEQVVPAGTMVTYILKVDLVPNAPPVSISVELPASTCLQGATTSYDNLTKVEQGGLLWSDGSNMPHVSTAGDYCDCRYVAGLPSDSQTLSK